MKKLNILIIVIVLLVLANMTVMVFLSGGSKMAENNGAAVLTKHRDFTKTVTIQLMIKGGLFAENKENNGIGSLFSRVWVKSNKVLETVEFYGGSVSAKVSPFALEVRLSVPSDKIDKVYNDFAAFLAAPEFKEDIFEREKMQHIDELRTSLDNPNLIAQNGFMALAFKGSPYEMPVEGMVESVEKITFEDIIDFHQRFEAIHPFQDGNGRVGRLIMFRECLRNGFVPFIISDELKIFYYNGLRNWPEIKGYLMDTCLTAQDSFKLLLDKFRIEYDQRNSRT